MLTLIARSGALSSSEIRPLIEWLSVDPDNALTYYTLTTVLAAFDTVDPSSHGGKLRKALAVDPSLLTFMKRKFEASTQWKNPGLKASVLLKWTLFLTETRHHDPSLESREGFKTEDLETQIWNAVQGDSFTFLTTAVLHLQKKSGNNPKTSYAHNLALNSEQEQIRQVPGDEYRMTVLFALEHLIRSLITYASSELRKIKQRQEDLVHSSTRSDRTTRFRNSSTPIPPPQATQPTPRNDIALLFSFIGLLYSALPAEKGLQYWGAGPQPGQPGMTYLEYAEFNAGRLPSFLQWAVWTTQVRDLDMSMALYDMLSGLAKGQQCSELAYNFMARGSGEVLDGGMGSMQGSASSGPSISWKVVFALLESWALSGVSSNPPPPTNAPGPFNFSHSAASHSQSRSATPQPQHHQVELGTKEVLLAQAFLRLLSTTVTHSIAVRVALSGNPQFRAIPTIVALVPMGVPLELKGALFETLAAFCEPGARAQGVEICKAVWTLMEKLEVINVRAPSHLAVAVKGVEVELEEVETIYKLYPATIPFLKLLATLIHTPKRVRLPTERGVDLETTNTSTIPETLGQPYRLPGIAPYIAFVIDNVFLKIPSREYLHSSNRWEMNDLSLAFVERVLASYDLETLLSSPEDAPLQRETVARLLIHPGYDVMSRLLTNSPLQASLLSYLLDGVEGFDKGLAEQEPFFQSTIVRAMRIALRLLEIQDIFIDVLIPITSDFDSASFIDTIHPRSYFTRFDQALSFGSQYVPAIAAYVAYPSCPEIVHLAVKIMTTLSAAPTSSFLTSLIERSADSDRIVDGFRQIMAVETYDEVAASETAAEQTTGAGAPDQRSASSLLPQAIRLAALDMFLLNTEHDQRYPNIAHFLLFGSSEKSHQIQDPHALGSRRTSIHVILDLLNTGIPRLKEDRHNPTQGEPLFAILPALAERCYRVIYQLCTHPRTSESTMRYLRTREDFFARHLAAIPSEAPPNDVLPLVEVRYNDGARVISSVSAVSSFLRLHSCVMDMVALELHVETNKGHHRGVTEILEVLFGHETNEEEDDSNWDDPFRRPFHEIGQSQLRIIEFVVALNFDWSDSIVAEAVDLQFFSGLNLQSCIRPDPAGCDVVDRNALVALLASAKRTLHSQGRIVTPAHLEQINAEVKYILESCVVENHRRAIQHATARGYDAWRRLLDTALTKCFVRLPHDRREGMVFDLLHILPGIIRSPEIQEVTAVVLSEAVLSCMTRLREDRQQQLVIQSAGGDAEAGSLPAERLSTLLRSLVECILDNNRLELVRGNLYAALISYGNLIHSAPHSTVVGRPLLTMSANGDDGRMFSESRSSLGGGSQVSWSRSSGSIIEKSSLSAVKQFIERLVATVSRDAIDGTEVWKTIAFMFLDSLVQMSRFEKPNVVLTSLSRHGIMSNFVRSLKDSDGRLQAVLKPDPGVFIERLFYPCLTRFSR